MSAPPDVTLEAHARRRTRGSSPSSGRWRGRGRRSPASPTRTATAIELAVVEGFSNVIRHGYGGRTDQRIEIRLRVPPGTFRIELDDWATFVDPSRIASRPLDEVRPGGLGVHLMRSTMDVVDYLKNRARRHDARPGEASSPGRWSRAMNVTTEALPKGDRSWPSRARWTCTRAPSCARSCARRLEQQGEPRSWWTSRRWASSTRAGSRR